MGEIQVIYPPSFCALDYDRKGADCEPTLALLQIPCAISTRSTLPAPISTIALTLCPSDLRAIFSPDAQDCLCEFLGWPCWTLTVAQLQQGHCWLR